MAGSEGAVAADLMFTFQQIGLGGAPGEYGAEHQGQIVTGFADGSVGGGHQKGGRHHHHEGDDADDNVSSDVFHGSFLLNK